MNFFHLFHLQMLTDPESVCQDVPFHCEEPWIVPGNLNHVKDWFPEGEDHLKCIANFGLGKGYENICEENGGEKLYYSRLNTPPGKKGPLSLMTSWNVLTKFGKCKTQRVRIVYSLDLCTSGSDLY